MTFKIGAHVSISGGPKKAVQRQKQIGGNVGQIFAGSPRGWKVSTYDEKDFEDFKTARNEENQTTYVIHSTYLANLATPKDGLWAKSKKCIQNELYAARDLGVDYVVFHPGAHTGSGLENGIKRIAQAINDLDIPKEVMLLLENTAGKGTTIGKSMEELHSIIELVDDDSRVGVCIDTCHAHASGYDLANKTDELVQEIENTFGLDKLKVIHLNDSKDPMGSEKDNHEHIGEGNIGEEGFKAFINHPKLKDLPMILETPVSDDKGYAWNVKKIKSLRK